MTLKMREASVTFGFDAACPSILQDFTDSWGWAGETRIDLRLILPHTRRLITDA